MNKDEVGEAVQALMDVVVKEYPQMRCYEINIGVSNYRLRFRDGIISNPYGIITEIRGNRPLGSDDFAHGIE